MRLCRLFALASLLLAGCPSPEGPAPSLGKERASPPAILARGTYYPNATEAETVGPIAGRIARGSPRFERLVRYRGATVVFKDEESTGADRLMTPRTAERVERLAVLVAREWPGVSLRVTEAWDEDLEHGESSIHYEGRAVDLTTSDQSTARLGRLAGLAIAAGFDWVLHEATHVHASVAR